MFADYKSWMFNAGKGPTVEEGKESANLIVVDVVVN